MTDPTLPPKVHAVLLSLRDPSLPPLAPYQQLSSSSLSTSPITSDSHSHSHSHPQEPHPPLSPETYLPILAIPSIRIFTSGPSLLVDVELVLPEELTLKEANRIEGVVEEALIKELGGPGRVREVVVRLKGGEEGKKEGDVFY